MTEDEANYFAMCFLLPEKEVRKAVEEMQENGTIDIVKLAKRFRVETPVMYDRLVDLHIVPVDRLNKYEDREEGR